ncbi:MAG: hypothetical protein O2864_07000 [Crenarchaeota archaeon]|nr:hypothetical protein [Thermoproteota archaeon]
MRILLFSVLTIAMIGLMVPSAYAQVSISNEIGTVNLDKDRISISRHFDEHLKIYGSISDPGRGTKVIISITDPNGDIDPASQQIFAKDDGHFETFKIMNWESLRGTYTVLVSYNGNVIGSLLFLVQELDENPANTQTQKQIPHDAIPTLEITIITALGSSTPGCEPNCFVPSTVTISPGGVVTFLNNDPAAHTSTAGTPEDGPSGVWDSSLVLPGSAFTTPALDAGEYPYFCMVHPWMTGLVIVGDGITNQSEQVSESEPTQEPYSEELGIASFVDQTKNLQYYIDRYDNEPQYKEWFDENYPQYSSIYQAVGLDEPVVTQTNEPEFTPEPTEIISQKCGAGTELVDGVCQTQPSSWLTELIDKIMSFFNWTRQF